MSQLHKQNNPFRLYLKHPLTKTHSWPILMGNFNNWRYIILMTSFQQKRGKYLRRLCFLQKTYVISFSCHQITREIRCITMQPKKFIDIVDILIAWNNQLSGFIIIQVRSRGIMQKRIRDDFELLFIGKSFECTNASTETLKLFHYVVYSFVLSNYQI